MTILVDRLAENGIDFDSGSIDLVGYDRETKSIFVEFENGYDVYEYPGFEESTFNLFVDASSLNHFWRDHISGKVDSIKHDDAGSNALELREDALTEDEADLVDLQPTVQFVTDEFDAGSPLPLSRFSVAYTAVFHDAEGNKVGPEGPFKPEFLGLSEADVLAQHAEAVENMERLTGWTAQSVTVTEVTHYLV